MDRPVLRRYVRRDVKGVYAIPIPEDMKIVPSHPDRVVTIHAEAGNYLTISDEGIVAVYSRPRFESLYEPQDDTDTTGLLTRQQVHKAFTLTMVRLFDDRVIVFTQDYMTSPASSVGDYFIQALKEVAPSDT